MLQEAGRFSNWPGFNQPSRCPQCGYCPCCGRSNGNTWPTQPILYGPMGSAGSINCGNTTVATTTTAINNTDINPQ